VRTLVRVGAGHPALGASPPPPRNPLSLPILVPPCCNAGSTVPCAGHAGEKIAQGREKVKSYLEDNPQAATELEAVIRDKMLKVPLEPGAPSGDDDALPEVLVVPEEEAALAEGEAAVRTGTVVKTK
jgi:hypothetical protein